MILYAPLIDSNVPGFIYREQDTVIRVNFMHNMAVGQVSGMLLAFKPHTNIGNDWHEIYQFDQSAINIKQGYVDFKCTDYNFTLGDFYKIKIAYCEGTLEEPTSGPYSTIGIGRCAGDHNTKISVLSGIRQTNMELSPSPVLNSNQITYIGQYETNLASEIVYKYRFTFKEEKSESYWQDTGWLIRTDPMSFTVPYELEYFKNYILTYEIITVNGLKLSATYPIMKTGEIPGYYTGQVFVSQDTKAIENGYIQIQLTGENIPDGNFRLIRRCLDETPAQWEELTQFKLGRLSQAEKFIWKDLSIEQGKTYKYAIQQYSTHQKTGAISYAQKVESQPITAEFEHIFIGDGTRQLRLAFNPQVSSIKETILEQKTDTLTNRYPFFFRNGDVRYKELPISGLLSYFMDLDELFMPQSELIRYTDTKLNLDINLTGANFYAERKFKMEVLEWLNNGQFKIFRSPAEGNYIIRLMNVSLSPNATVGRMLHTVSATGYEAMEYKRENLQTHKLVSYDEHELYNVSEKNFSVDYIGKNLENGANSGWYRIHIPMADYIEVAFLNGPVGKNLQTWLKNNKEPNSTIYTFDEMGQTVVIFNQKNTQPTYFDFSIQNSTVTDIENLQISVRYKYTTNGTEQFGKRISFGNFYLFTLASKDEIEVGRFDDQETVFFFALQAEADGTNTEDVSFTLVYKDGTESDPLIVKPGEKREYYNIHSVAGIRKDKGVALHCYVYMHSNISSELGKFILNQSTLQGVD